MSNKIELKSLAVGVFLGAAVVLAVAAGTTNGTPSAWQYKVISGDRLNELEDRLNTAGKDGWEVVSSLQVGVSVYSVAKRPSR